MYLKNYISYFWHVFQNFKYIPKTITVPFVPQPSTFKQPCRIELTYACRIYIILKNELQFPACQQVNIIIMIAFNTTMDTQQFSLHFEICGLLGNTNRLEARRAFGPILFNTLATLGHSLSLTQNLNNMQRNGRRLCSYQIRLFLFLKVP